DDGAGAEKDQIELCVYREHLEAEQHDTEYAPAPPSHDGTPGVKRPEILRPARLSGAPAAKVTRSRGTVRCSGAGPVGGAGSATVGRTVRVPKRAQARPSAFRRVETRIGVRKGRRSAAGSASRDTCSGPSAASCKP